MLELQGAASAVTVAFGARIVASTDVINLGIGSAASLAVPDNFDSNALERNVWYTVELKVNIETNATGTVDMYVTRQDRKYQETADVSLSSITHIAVTDGVLGLQDHETTTTGTILIDNFIQDDGRIYAERDRFKKNIFLTKSGHALIGPGRIDNVSLYSGAGTDCVLSIYDTDSADVNDSTNLRAELKNTANNELVDPAGMPVDVTRGAYIDMSGTNPRAMVKICKANIMSNAGIRNYGLRRKVI